VQSVHASSSPQQIALVPVSRSLSHTDACRIADRALGERRARTVILDLKHVADATTSAFARLVLLRRLLLRNGRDLRLVNLRDRAASVYHVNRLAGVLPCG
jgi:MFS superfamily sulfate permease-like transporter